MLRRVLLFCGLAAAAIYVGSDIYAALSWERYSYVNQSVSELRAIGAQTRPLLVTVLTLYSLLELAFAIGVWLSAGQKRALRIAAVFLFALALLDLSAYFTPMQQRDAISQTGRTLGDTLHLVGTAATVLLIFMIIGFGAFADGRWFRIYSWLTIAVLLAAGLWSAMDAPRIEAALPTPWVGIKERINIYGYMFWLAAFSIVLLRAQASAASAEPPANTDSPQPAHL